MADEVDVSFQDLALGVAQFKLHRADGLEGLGPQVTCAMGIEQARNLHCQRGRARDNMAGFCILAKGARGGNRVDAEMPIEARGFLCASPNRRVEFPKSEVPRRTLHVKIGKENESWTEGLAGFLPWDC